MLARERTSSTLRFRRLDKGCDKDLAEHNLGNDNEAEAVNRQEVGDANCHGSSQHDAMSEATAEFIRAAWPHLQPHVREAIITLIDCASTIHRGNGGAS